MRSNLNCDKSVSSHWLRMNCTRFKPVENPDNFLHHFIKSPLHVAENWYLRVNKYKIFSVCTASKITSFWILQT